VMPDNYQRAYYLRRKEEVAYVTFQISHDELALLDRAAKRENLTRSEKIRELITWSLLNEEKFRP